MGFFKHLFQRGKEGSPSETGVSERSCTHVVLRSRWDSAEDMGKPEKMAGYICESCGVSLSFEEGEKLKTERARPESRE